MAICISKSLSLFPAWPPGCLRCWLAGCLACLLPALLALLSALLAGWLTGYLSALLVGCLAGCLLLLLLLPPLASISTHKFANYHAAKNEFCYIDITIYKNLSNVYITFRMVVYMSM